MPRIHPSAHVDPSAEIAAGVTIGPNVFIDADVAIGSGTQIMHGAHIGRWTKIGANNRIFPFAAVGLEPQDLGYHGEEAFTLIGDGNTIREGCTIHRGNRPGTTTLVGNHNFFMVNSHIAHNCVIGSNVILVNGALLAGHVQVDDRAIISGNCQVHQFVRIGAYAMMRGGSGAVKDVPPFCINDGISWIRAINAVGLRRNGFSASRIRTIKDAFKIIFRSGLPLEEALHKVEEGLESNPDLHQMVSFIRASKRGIGSGRRSGGEE